MTDAVNESAWLLIDIEGENANFGICDVNASRRVEHRRQYRATDFSTATDCILTFARETGLSVRNRRMAMVVSGAVGIDSIRIERSRWIISKSGLEQLFGVRPSFINDSVAKAWGNVGQNWQAARALGGSGQIDWSKPGTVVAINYSTGLGAAIIRVSPDGRISVAESECGHIGFAPQNAIERELYDVLARANPRVTYERVLMLDRNDPIWDGLSQPVARDKREQILAGILGSFAGDLVLAFAAWSGVIINGTHGALLANSACVMAFNDRFGDKGHFRMNVRAAPRWLGPAGVSNIENAASMAANLS